LGLYFPHTIQDLLIKYTSGFFMLFTVRAVEKRSRITDGVCTVVKEA